MAPFHDFNRLMSQVCVGNKGETISNEALAQSIEQNIGLQVPALLQKEPNSSLRTRVAKTAQPCSLTIEAFVEQCRGQLELEEAEEVAQAEEELTNFSSAGAQVHARSTTDRIFDAA